MACSDIVILGGTFVPLGGHNIFEPAKMSKPIFCGPYTARVSDTLNKLKVENAAIQVSTEQELKTSLKLLLSKPKQDLKYMGKQAYKVASNIPLVKDEIMSLIYKKIMEL